MNPIREDNSFLTVRLGNCERCTETDGKLSRRVITHKCAVISNTLKGEDQPGSGDEIELSFVEADTGEDIGCFYTLGYIQLSLPPAAFAEFWTASGMADGAARNVSLQCRKPDSSGYTVSKVRLVEYMPEPIDFNSKGLGLGNIRVHPVVEELRHMRRLLTISWRDLHTFAAFVGLVLGMALIVFGLRALWGLISG